MQAESEKIIIGQKKSEWNVFCVKRGRMAAHNEKVQSHLGPGVWDPGRPPGLLGQVSAPSLSDQEWAAVGVGFKALNM